MTSSRGVLGGLDPEVHRVEGDEAGRRRPRSRTWRWSSRLDVAEEQHLGRAVLLAELRDELGEDVELGVVGVGDVHVVVVVPAPEEGAAALDVLDVDGRDAVRLEHADLVRPEVVADRSDDADVGEEARREGEMARRTAEHPLALAERGPHGVEGDGSDDGQGHGRGTLAAPRGEKPEYASSGGAEVPVALGALAAIAAVLTAAPAPAREAPLRVRSERRIVTKRLFDIGVADPDRDGRQDIFTTNHKFRSVFLRNLGGRSFRERDQPDRRSARTRASPASTCCASRPTPTPASTSGRPTSPGTRAGSTSTRPDLPASGRISLLHPQGEDPLESSGADVAISHDDDNRPLVDFDDSARWRVRARLERPRRPADPVRVRRDRGRMR